MSLRLAALTTLALTAVPALAAQSPAKPPVAKRIEFQGDLGYVAVGGNTNVTTYNIGEKIIFRPARWVFTQNLGVIYGKSAGIINASSIAAGVRGDYGFTPRLSIYTLGKFAHDSFAGIRSRWEESAGLSTKVFDTAYDQFSFELGLGLIQQTPTLGAPARNFVSARTAGAYRHNFTKAAFAQQTIEVLPNLKQGDDYRINSETSLVAPISSHIALKSAFVIHFDNLPEPGFKPTDRIFTSGLQITL
ncbi:MAG: YdiY family protein [Gemmatimonadales bacterium]